MSPSTHKILSVSILVTWLGAFTVFAAKFNISVTALQKTLSAYEQLTAQLNFNTSEIRDLVADISRIGHETTYLQNLVLFFPESEGFVRTQKALLQEVQTLRSKVGDRIKGRLHVLVDTKTNKLFVKKGNNLLWQADCSVGRGGVLQDKKTGRRWEFVTPRGKFKVVAKVENPIWHKPDWAFVEDGEVPPPPDDPRRKAPGELGAYVLSLGDGYLIHGTKNEQLLGQAVSHGCVRLGAENLKQLYEQVPMGTEVYIL